MVQPESVEKDDRGTGAGFMGEHSARLAEADDALQTHSPMSQLRGSTAQRATIREVMFRYRPEGRTITR